MCIGSSRGGKREVVPVPASASIEAGRLESAREAANALIENANAAALPYFVLLVDLSWAAEWYNLGICIVASLLWAPVLLNIEGSLGALSTAPALYAAILDMP